MKSLLIVRIEWLFGEYEMKGKIKYKKEIEGNMDTQLSAMNVIEHNCG
jgi:hypothetical protein